MKARAIVLLATVSALLAVTAPAGAVVPAELALRLTDLGPGYVVEDDACELRTFDDEGPSRIPKQIGELHHTGCGIGFWRVWKVPGTPAGPLRVSSYAFVFDSADGPELALTRPRAVVASLSGDAPEVVQPVPAVGDEAVLLDGETQRVGRRSWWSATVLWRSGNVLAAVRTISQRSAEASEQAALGLAAVQQARISSPTRLDRRTTTTPRWAWKTPASACRSTGSATTSPHEAGCQEFRCSPASHCDFAEPRPCTWRTAATRRS